MLDPHALALHPLWFWGSNPHAYAQHVLGVRPWARQADVLLAAAMSPRVVVRSGHKIGTTLTAAILAHWWARTRSSARTVLTSSTPRALQALLWSSLRRLDPSIAAPSSLPLQHRLANGNELLGLSPEEPGRFAGFGDETLFVVDNAEDVPDAVFAALEGPLLHGAHCVVLGKPTKTTGAFRSLCLGETYPRFRCLAVSSEESPNVKAGRIVVSGLATAEWVDEKRAEWGEDSELFRTRVLGEFPT